MSLSRNVAANYLGQIYLALLGFAVLPVYLRWMGAEQFGLVGFFTMLQAWFVLLDLGLTPTMAREIARSRGGAADRAEIVAMIRTLEWLFASVGIAVALAVAAAAGWIGRDWLRTENLEPDELRWAVTAMGVVIGLRGWSGLYRGGLTGLEQLVPLNVAAVVLGTLRMVGVIAVLPLAEPAVVGFFCYQVLVAIVELVVMRALFRRHFPMGDARFGPSRRALRGLLGLSGGMVFLAAVWIVFSQFDRLVLSGRLELTDYGYFSVATTLAGAITLLSAPISQALQPRFSLLVARGSEAEMVALYRLGTQAVSALVFAIAGTMSWFAQPLVRAWTNDPGAEFAAARVVPLYAMGNAIVALLGLAFLVQFAYGRVRWQVIGNCIFGAIWLPGAWLAAQRAGAVGTGWVWLAGNFLYLVAWLPYVHSRLLPGIALRWLVADVGAVALAVAAALALASRLDLGDGGRLRVFASAGGITAALALAGLAAGSETRRLLLERLRRFAWMKAR